MKKSLLILFVLSALFLNTVQGQNIWTKKTNFGGEKRTRAVSFAIGDYGYVGCGEDTVEMTHNDLWRYDPSADVWSQMMTLPASTRRNATGVAIGDKGYVGLGADSSVSTAGSILSDWWEYDPVSNGWTQKASYPGGIDIFGNSGIQGVYFATAFSIDTKGYVCGGKMGSDFYGTDLWEYDPGSDLWTRMADFPGGDRYQLSSFGVEGNGYVGMGIDHDLFRKDWWKYDPSLNSWTQTTSLPGSERGAASTFVLGQRGFVVFGSDGGYKDELWQYNPFTESWNIKANFPPSGRKNGIAFAIGDKGYAGTGSSATGKKRSFYEYAPLHPIGFSDNEPNNMSIFPNPVQDKATIEFSVNNGANKIEIWDLTGKLILSNGVNAGSVVQVSNEQFESGTYIIILKDNADHILLTDKLIFL